MKQKIYRELIASGETCSLPAPWDGLDCHKAFVRFPTDLGPTLEKLNGQFEELELVAAGVLVPDGEKGVKLNPQLAEFNDYVLAIAQPKTPAFVIAGLRAITGLRAIDDGSPALIELLESSQMETLVHRVRGKMFIAFSAADLAVLWSLGLPAIPCDELATIGGQYLEALCSRLRLSQPDDRKPKSESSRFGSLPEQTPLFPVLVNWSPATLGLGNYPEALKVDEHFRKVSRILNFNLSGGGLWKPTEEQLERFAFSLKYGNNVDVWKAFLKSAEVDRVAFLDTEAAAFGATDLLGRADNDWIAACASDDQRKQSEAWTNLRRVQQQEVIEPLRQLRRETSDPILKNDLLTLSELSDIAHQKASIVGARLSKGIQDHGLKLAGQMPLDELRSVENLAKGIYAQTKAIRCRVNKSKKLAKPQAEKSSSPSSKNSV